MMGGKADLHDPCSGERVPFHVVDGRLLWKPRVPNPGHRPFVIISLQKSGTYLAAQALEAFGLVDTEIHAQPDMVSDTRGLTLKEKRGPQRGLRSLPLNVSAGMVGPGQFMVGHIPRTPETERCFAGFTKIVCVRELRACLVSFLRFMTSPAAFAVLDEPWQTMEPGPDQMLAFLEGMGRRVMTDYSHIVGWIDDWMDDLHRIICRYEVLLGDNGHAERNDLLALLAAVAWYNDDPVAAFKSRVLGRKTRTSSGSRSRVEDYWSDDVEREFVALGGSEMNRRLGYS